MNSTTVKGVLLLAGLTLFAGSVSALSVDGFSRRVSNPREVLLAHDARVPDVSCRFIGRIDADVLDWDYKKAVIPTVV